MITISDLITRIYSVTTSIMKRMEVNKVNIKHMDIKVATKNYRKDKDGYKGAIIEGGYNHYLNLMIDKHLGNN